MRHDRVDETGQDNGEDEVRDELGALRDGTDRDGRGGGGEGPLEEEVSPVTQRCLVHGVHAATDETVLARGSTRTVRKPVPEQVERDGPRSTIQDVLDEDVHGVLGADRTGTELHTYKKNTNEG